MEEKEKIIEIEIERLKDFKEHPFQVKDDEEMRQAKQESELNHIDSLEWRISKKKGFLLFPRTMSVSTQDYFYIPMI